jgi:hypothetical protein
VWLIVQRNQEKGMVKRNNYFGPWLAIGIGTGISIGVALKNIGAGLAIGVGFGLLMGKITAMKKEKDDKEKKQ